MIVERTPLTVVLADDSALFRSGLAGLLGLAGLMVLAEVADVPGALEAAQNHRPDVIILDVRMPPAHTDEGINAALELRDRHPGMGIMVLSTYAESEWVSRLLAIGPDRLGYMLKDRVDDVTTLIEGLHRVAQGGTAIDPYVISGLLSHRAHGGALDRLTVRERDVLALMAEGLTNAAISRRLFLAPKTIEAHVASIFVALGLAADADVNRRVRAVLTFLRSSKPAGPV